LLTFRWTPVTRWRQMVRRRRQVELTLALRPCSTRRRCRSAVAAGRCSTWTRPRRRTLAAWAGTSRTSSGADPCTRAAATPGSTRPAKPTLPSRASTRAVSRRNFKESSFVPAGRKTKTLSHQFSANHASDYLTATARGVTRDYKSKLRKNTSAAADWLFSPLLVVSDAASVWWLYATCNFAIQRVPTHLFICYHVELSPVWIPRLPCGLRENRPPHIVPGKLVLGHFLLVLGV